MLTLAKRLIGRAFYRLGYGIVKAPRDAIRPGLRPLTLGELTRIMNGITYFEDKQKFRALYRLDTARGMFDLDPDVLAESLARLEDLAGKYGLRYVPDALPAEGRDRSIPSSLDKINYGCGSNLLDGWLNVDIAEKEPTPNYMRVNLLERHPFDDGTFRFGFAEDVLEHFHQDDAIIFLSEAFRCLREGGVMRLSFPGLEPVLATYFSSRRELMSYECKVDAYLYWDHVHFLSRDEIALIARHLGYKEVTFVEYGKSRHEELAGLDTRSGQIGLNTYVELVK